MVYNVEVNNHEKKDRAAYGMKGCTWLDVSRKKICIFMEPKVRSFI